MIKLPSLNTPQIALFAFLAGVAGGWVVHGWKEDSGHLSVILQAQERADKLLSTVDTQSAELASLRAIQRPQDRIIIKEVFKYADATPAADRVILPSTWRVRHDSSALGEPAESRRFLDGDTGPVADATALETVAENYETCRAWRQDLIAWQRFWQAVKSAE